MGDPLAGTYGRLLRATGRAHPEGLFHIDHLCERILALTIDDGPSPRTTEILDLLEQYNSRATFFVHTDPLEQETSGRAILTRMLESGHEVANHMPKDRASILLSPDEFASEFVRAHESLVALGHTPRFFRAAGGFYHADRMLPSLKRLAYYERFVMASYLPWDVYLPLPESYARQLASGAFPGAIFVLHDGGARGSARLDRTIKTLSLLLPLLASQGYRMEPLGHVMAQAG